MPLLPLSFLCLQAHGFLFSLQSENWFANPAFPKSGQASENPPAPDWWGFLCNLQIGSFLSKSSFSHLCMNKSSGFLSFQPHSTFPISFGHATILAYVCVRVSNFIFLSPLCLGLWFMVALFWALERVQIRTQKIEARRWWRSITWLGLGISMRPR